MPTVEPPNVQNTPQEESTASTSLNPEDLESSASFAENQVNNQGNQEPAKGEDTDKKGILSSFAGSILQSLKNLGSEENKKEDQPANVNPSAGQPQGDSTQGSTIVDSLSQQTKEKLANLEAPEWHELKTYIDGYINKKIEEIAVTKTQNP